MSWRDYLTLPEYNLMHVHRRRHYSKTGRCEFCNQKARTQWSNKSGEYRSADDTFDWQELCSPCHYIYDIDFHSTRRLAKCSSCRVPTYDIKLVKLISNKRQLKTYKLCYNCRIDESLYKIFTHPTHKIQMQAKERVQSYAWFTGW